jgi:hypothetical protein
MQDNKQLIQFQSTTDSETVLHFKKYIDDIKAKGGLAKNGIYLSMCENFINQNALHNIVMAQNSNIGLSEAMRIAERITTSPDFQKLLEKHFKNL